MSEQKRIPSRRELMRPWELIIGSLIAALFAGVIVFAGTRNWEISLIAVGGIFIITVMALAMFVLSFKPNAEELADIDEQDHPSTPLGDRPSTPGTDRPVGH